MIVLWVRKIQVKVPKIEVIHYFEYYRDYDKIINGFFKKPENI
jgi:hypothetical protein